MFTKVGNKKMKMMAIKKKERMEGRKKEKVNKERIRWGFTETTLLLHKEQIKTQALLFKPICTLIGAS